MAKKTKLITALILNILILAFEVVGMIIRLPEGDMASNVVFYTVDSNIFLLFSTIPFIIYSIKSLVKKDIFIPKWVVAFKYFAVCTVAVTFTVVVTILPIDSRSGGLLLLLTAGSMLYQHAICPVLAIVTFILFEKDTFCINNNSEIQTKPAGGIQNTEIHCEKIEDKETKGTKTQDTKIHFLTFRYTFFALIPTLVYAAVLYPLNIANLVLGPYPFLAVYEIGAVMAVVWFFIVAALCYLLALLIWWGNRKILSS